MQRQEVDARIGLGWADLAEDFRVTPCGQAGTRLIEAMRQRVVQLIEDAAVTRRDIDLSDIGRERKLRRLAAAAKSDDAVGEALEACISVFAARGAALESAIAEATRIARPSQRFEIALDAEIRTHLRGLDREERFGLLDLAARRGETDPLRAFFTAPAFLSGLSDSEAESIRQRAAATRAAVETRELEVLERATELIRAAERSYERLVAELTEDPGSSWRIESNQREALLRELLSLEEQPRVEN